HLVVDCWPGAPTDTIYAEAHSDGRPILVIPWNGMMLLGSTDVRFDGDPGTAITTAAEVSYLLDEVNRLFPTANLTPEHIRYSYAGIRPLPRTQSGREGAITRRHIIKDHAPQVRGLFSIIGGKLTTHRSLAEQVVDKVAARLGSDARSSTAHAALPGAAWGTSAAAEPAVSRLLASLRLDPALATRLAATYGALSADILAPVRDDPSLGERVGPDSPLMAAEIAWAVQHEMARTLTDLLMRRTMVGLGPSLARDLIEPAADHLARYLGWSTTERKSAIEEHLHWLTRLQPEQPATP
ncbi:MAG TPA: FAD-dependent oxidoreductase, partial [Thermomicrobiales bacterium]|nr:FAD-dependent oxidoreductase [Thermomicrobiales bacterium]